MQEINYFSGGGTVIVVGDTVLLLAAPTDADLVTSLWRVLVAGMTDDQVRAVLQTYSPALLPDLGVASLRPAGLALLLRGSVRASVDGETYSHTDDRQPWTEHVVTPATTLRLWLGGPVPTGPGLPLVGGVARADSVLAGLAGTAAPSLVAPRERSAAPGRSATPVQAPPPPAMTPGYATPSPVATAPPIDGVFLDRPAPPPADPAPAAISSISQVWVGAPPPSAPPAAAAVPSQPQVPAAHLQPTDLPPVGSTPLIAGASAGQRPAVWGARCPQAHLNPPDATACRVCGSTITDRELSIFPRPPLGRLDFGDLGAVPLDGDLVIGREPGTAAPDGARTVTIAHPGLSRRHLEVQVRDWLVVVVDLDSNNGTTVALPGRAPEPLRGRDPMPIQPGTVVTLAQQVPFTYVAGA